jgi:hypothetical protein
MTILLDPAALERLAKLCGMFGSHHDGERAAAAAMADKLVRENGLTWQQVISRPAPSVPETAPEKIAFALANIGALSMWERGFVYGVNGKRSISPKQLVVLDQIVDKIRAYAQGGE